MGYTVNGCREFRRRLAPACVRPLVAWACMGLEAGTTLFPFTSDAPRFVAIETPLALQAFDRPHVSRIGGFAMVSLLLYTSGPQSPS